MNDFKHTIPEREIEYTYGRSGEAYENGYGDYIWFGNYYWQDFGEPYQFSSHRFPPDKSKDNTGLIAVFKITKRY